MCKGRETLFPPISAAIFKTLQQRGALATQALLGRQCAHCQKPSDTLLCQNCRERIVKPPMSCRVCGIAMVANSRDGRCKDCLQTPPPYERLHYTGNYDDVLASLIVAAKIGKQVAAIAALREWIAQANATTELSDYKDYALLPMPIPTARLMQRGFNLPAIIAADLAQRHQLPLITPTTVTLPFFVRKQAKLSRQQRQQNRHLYQIHHNIGDKIIIVDDIFTTGTTITTLAKTLRQNKVKSVAAWAIARAQKHD